MIDYDATGDVIGQFRKELREGFKTAIDKLREEFRVGIGRLPIAKSWDPDEVSYRGDVVVRDGAVFQARKTQANRLLPITQIGFY